MSLILLSNDPKEASGLSAQKSNIYKAWSFRNSLTETITIPKNSEVALQSTKIVLDGQINIAPENKVFYLYLGETVLGENQGQSFRQFSTSLPVRIELFPNEPGVVRTNAEGLAQELGRVLRQNSYHPAYAKELQAAEFETRVEVLRDGDGDFMGYKFLVEHLTDDNVNNTVGNTSTDPQDNVVRMTLIQNRCAKDWIYPSRRNNPALREYNIYTAANQCILQPQVEADNMLASEFLSVANNTPLANTSLNTTRGPCRLTYNIDNVMTNPGGTPGVDDKNISWIAGITRNSISRQEQTNGRIGPPYFQWNYSNIDGPNSVLNDMLRGHADYLVVNDGRTIRLFNCNTWGGELVRPGTRGNLKKYRWQEVDYTEGGTNATFPTLYDTTTNTSGFAKLHFELSGNRVKIYFENTGRNLFTLWEYSQTITNGGARARLKNEQCKPIDISCWDLQPVMGIYNRAWRGLIGNGGTFNPTDYLISISEKNTFTTYDPYVTDIAEYDANTTNISYYQFLLQSDRNQFNNVMSELNLRDGLAPENPIPAKYGTFDTTTHTFVTCLQPVIIATPSDRYLHTSQANTSRLLGLQIYNGVASGKPPWLLDGYDAVSKRTVFRLESGEKPTSLSTKSIFVRLENFTQTSVNAGNGNKSSIIAHLPRFDGQNQTGRLFFEPKNLMYLDLKNTNELKINSFDVSFVYADESYCTSLVGTTNVVLHIRQKKE
tara:strand:+ start:9709 stop:11859 length:2151 start_codon:yes stop_codon:yes gene_type:complete